MKNDSEWSRRAETGDAAFASTTPECAGCPVAAWRPGRRGAQPCLSRRWSAGNSLRFVECDLGHQRVQGARTDRERARLPPGMQELTDRRHLDWPPSSCRRRRAAHPKRSHRHWNSTLLSRPPMLSVLDDRRILPQNSFERLVQIQSLEIKRVARWNHVMRLPSRLVVRPPSSLHVLRAAPRKPSGPQPGKNCPLTPRPSTW